MPKETVLQPAHPQGADVSDGLSIRRIRTVLGAALGLGAGFAPIFYSTLSVFLKPIATEFSWGRAQTTSAVVVANLGVAFGALIVGRLIDRWGAPRTIAMSSILMAALVAAMSSVPDQPIILALLSFAIGFVAVGTTPLGYLSVLPRLFDRNLGMAFGLAMAGLGIGTVLSPNLAQYLIASLGWRDAYLGLAATSAVVGFFAWLLAFAGYRDEPRGRSAIGPREAEGLTLRSSLQDWRFWLIALVLFTVSAGGLGFSVHSVPIMTDRGLAPETAASVAGTAAIGLMLGRLLGGILMDRLRATWVAAGCFALGAIGIALLALDGSNGIPLLTFACFLASFAIGAEGDFIPFSVKRYFGPRSFGSVYGFLFFAFAVGGVAGPIGFGAAFDGTGDYRGVLFAASGACLAAGAAVLLLGRYRFGLLEKSQRSRE